MTVARAQSTTLLAAESCGGVLGPVWRRVVVSAYRSSGYVSRQVSVSSIWVIHIRVRSPAHGDIQNARACPGSPRADVAFWLFWPFRDRFGIERLWSPAPFSIFGAGPKIEEAPAPEDGKGAGARPKMENLFLPIKRY